MQRFIFVSLIGLLLGVAIGTLDLLLGVAISNAKAQSNVPCWEVPNGLNRTMQCGNGFWQTVTPEGMVYSGNGASDPSATAMGSGIVINPGTGGPFIGAGTTVTPPTQVLPMLEPYQAQQYGFMPRQD